MWASDRRICKCKDGYISEKDGTVCLGECGFVLHFLLVISTKKVKSAYEPSGPSGRSLLPTGWDARPSQGYGKDRAAPV